MTKKKRPKYADKTGFGNLQPDRFRGDTRAMGKEQVVLSNQKSVAETSCTNITYLDKI